jgi:OmcA/MtrC family decaheme c-type cytochrome
MKSILIRLGLAALVLGTLAGCGGGSNASQGASGTPSALGAGAPGVPGNAAVVSVNKNVLSAADWQALRPVATIQSVSFASGVVVQFSVADQNGSPVMGLGGSSNNPTQTNINHVPANFNIAFTLDKLVPASNGAPSRWVSYNVTSPATTSTPASAVVVDGGISWTAGRPSSDSNGTLVDNGNGTYTYTFLRNITRTQSIIQNIINALPTGWTVTSGGVTTPYNAADLAPADLGYVPTATHRLGIIISGSQPGTGTATPTASTSTTSPNPVPLVYTYNGYYDFVPAGGTPANTRVIVTAGACDGCHDNVTQKRGIGHISIAGTSAETINGVSVTVPNGVPPGAYVGRNDPNLCVTCHTDQMKFGNVAATPTTNSDGSPAYQNDSTHNYARTASGVVGLDTAAVNYPLMIHQTHMGNQLIRYGYNLVGNCKGDSLAANGAQCFNQVGLPQDQRDCTKCHDGSATKSNGSTNANQTTDGDNWKNVPNRLACGACHDGINFATGTGITLADRDADLANKVAVGTTQSGHGGGAQADDSACSTCHTPATIATVHATPYDTLNSVALQSGVDTLAYNIGSVTVNASGQPVITFQILVNGTAVSSFAAATLVTNSSSGAVQVDPNFAPIPANPELVGASNLSFYAAYAVPQDGVATPADYNVSASASLANLLVASGSPQAGSITGPVGGWFTATLTGDMVGQPKTGTCKQNTGTSAITGNCVNPSPIHIPANATMVTGAIIGGLVEQGLAAYPYTAAVNGVGNSGGLGVTGVIAKQTASACNQAGITATQKTNCTTSRRVIVALSNCNNCHDRLGTSPVFHNISGTLGGAGYRNDPTACNFCHNANKMDNGFAVDSSTWMHGIHGASKRTVPFANNDGDFSTVLYPGQLKDCTQCHMPNTVNFGSGDSAQGGGNNGGTLAPNLLWSSVAYGKIATPANATFAVTNPQLSKTTDPVLNTSPWVTVGANYGNAFTFASQSAVLPSVTPASGSATSAVVVTNPLGQSVAADPNTLVNSPIASACSACHTDPTAWDHMRTNGGVLYGARGTYITPNITNGALVSPEACLACHGQGAIMDTAVIHQTQ